jgi:inorganic pyrophosphatase
MRLDAIAIGNNPPKDLNVVIEVPIGGEPIKYEMDKASGALFVDRFLYTSMRYPGNYGFVPHTLSSDGDPIDVLVCNTRAIAPGAVINCRPVGVLLMEDDGGGDEKLIAVPSSKLTQRAMIALRRLRTCPRSPWSKSSTFLPITRTWSLENG